MKNFRCTLFNTSLTAPVGSFQIPVPLNFPLFSWTTKTYIQWMIISIFKFVIKDVTKNAKWSYCMYHLNILYISRVELEFHIYKSTSPLLFITKAPMPTLWEAFAGSFGVVFGIQYTSIKYLVSAWWYQNPSCNKSLTEDWM